MIVADTNLLAYFLLEGDVTELADNVYSVDPVWLAPPLWRSEFRSVLLQNIRARRLDLAMCAAVWTHAETLVRDAPRLPDTGRVLEIAITRGLTSYDAEYVATAVDLSVPLVTADRRILNACPREAVSIEAFADGAR